MRKISLSVVALLWVLCSSAQGYYRFPLDLPHLLSANFGEMRTTHYHSGLDIKTNLRTGYPLYAAADGYISRVCTNSGFGRAVYVAHPNGTTTVYGHLESFTPEVERYLESERYRQQRNNVDLFPDATRFPVKQGDCIGYSGNAGHSFGAHLHYEIRQTSDYRTLNPISNGFVEVADSIPPTIVSVRYIEVDTIGGIPVRREPRTVDTRSDTPFEVGLNGYFVVETTDRKNDVANRFGVWRVSESVDWRDMFVFQFDGFLFGDTRNCNTTAEYTLQRNSRNEFVALAKTAGNRLDCYPVNVYDGNVRTPEGKTHDITIAVEDDNMNLASVSFRVVGRTTPAPAAPSGKPVLFDRRFTDTCGALTLTIPPRTLYESCYCDLQKSAVKVRHRTDGISPLSDIWTVGNSDIPADGYMTISVECRDTSVNALASVSDRGTLAYAGGRRKGSTLTARVRSFGRYTTVSDQTSPVIRASFDRGADLSGKQAVTFTMSDNFSGIASFDVTIDGQWNILEYNPMHNTATLNLDKARMSTVKEHILTFTATDACGNRAEFRTMFRK